MLFAHLCMARHALYPFFFLLLMRTQSRQNRLSFQHHHTIMDLYQCCTEARSAQTHEMRAAGQGTCNQDESCLQLLGCLHFALVQFAQWLTSLLLWEHARPSSSCFLFYVCPVDVRTTFSQFTD